MDAADVTVLPWSLCWQGFVLFAGGATIALIGNEQRRRIWLATAAKWVSVVGFCLLVGPPLVNGTVMFLHGMAGIMHEMAMASRPDQSFPDR